MKNFYVIISFILFSIVSNAQNATPNPGFENWTTVGNRVDPDNWNTLNPSTAIIGVLTCTRATGADAHSGSYAIKLTTKSVFGVTANGIASTGTLITTPPYGVSGGIPFTGRPDSITGWYKYTPAGTDSGFVELQLLGTVNTDTIGYVRFSTPNSTVSTYTRFSKAVTYISPANPANSIWILSSSRGSGPQVNSSIIFDDIAMVFNGTGINEQNSSPIQLIKNPVKEFMTFNIGSFNVFKISLIDITGKIVVTEKISQLNNSIAIKGLTPGIYFYILENQNGQRTTSGKVLIEQ
jgi:hypothetical protein